MLVPSFEFVEPALAPKEACGGDSEEACERAVSTADAATIKQWRLESFLTGCLGITFLIACLIGAQAEGTAEWITVNKDYYSQRYVELDGITPANVSGLKEVCETDLNEPAYFNSGM